MRRVTAICGVAFGISLLLASTAAFARADDPRGVKIRGSDLETVLGANASIPRYHALVIGINRYRHWQDLRNARTDAEEVAGLLSNRYGFQAVTTLYDEQATRNGISLALRRLTEQLGENDALLVFHAGHGYFDKLLNRGYWVPHEALERAEGAPATTDWFSNNELQDFIAALRARHVLVVSDSCFSGSLFRGGVPDLSDKANAWYRRAIQQPSRWGISSGDLELVPDNSIFARQFVNALQYPLKPVFSASDLAGRIKVEVAGATGTQPLFGRLQAARDSRFGEFIFLDFGGVLRRPADDSTVPVAPGAGGVTAVSPSSITTGHTSERTVSTPLGAYNDITRGLIAYYPFDGNANDESGNRNHGKASNNRVFDAQSPGVRNGCADFTRGNDWVTLTSQPFNFGTGPFSFSVWVKINNYPTGRRGSEWGTIIEKRNWGANHNSPVLLILPDRRVAFGGAGWYSLARDDILSQSELQLNQWHHVVGVRGHNTQKIFINGKLDSTGQNVNIYSGNAFDLNIGARPYVKDSYVSGFVDEVRIYKRELSSIEVQELYRRDLR